MPARTSTTNRAGRTSRVLLLVPILLLFPHLPLAAQADSPSPRAIMGLPDDAAKVMQLSDLCFAYRTVDKDSAELFGQAALRLARKLGFAKGEAQAYNDLAILRIDRSSYAEADSLLHASLALRRQMGDSAGMAAVHNKLGIIYQAQFMLDEALKEDLSALAIYERIGPKAHEATLLNNIGVLQFNLGRLKAALATHQRAVSIRSEVGDSIGVAASLGNMANVEMQMGDTVTAIGHYRQAVSYFRAKGLISELAIQLHNLATLELAMGDVGGAARDHAEALRLRQELGEPKSIASSLIGLGGTRLVQGRMRAAADLLHQGLSLARATNSRSEEMQALLDLAQLHALLDHGDSVFLFHQAYSALKDSVFNADMSQRLAMAETRFEAEKKEREILGQRAAIAELEHESEHRLLWLVTALGGLALVVLGSLLLMQVQRRRAKARRDAAIIREREAGLQGVLEATEKERERIARELHDGIGQQVAGLKFRLEEIGRKASDDQPVAAGSISEALSITGEVGREVRNIAHALMPRALEQMGLATAMGEMLGRSFDPARIGHTFDQFGLDERLTYSTEIGLYRICQELVQNTLKHAGADHVNVQLLRNKGHVVLLYEDNGKGLDGKSGSPDGIGLRNMRERARSLGGSATFGPGRPQGLIATIRIPVEGASI